MPNIKTFCRIKPTSEVYEEFDILNNKLCLQVPEQLKDIVSSKPGSRPTINHEFNFDYIFNSEATQEEVFDVAASEIVNAFLSGYNGTIFAYGQTGTGKTYTVEGSATTYKARGLEPRALSLIYRELEKRTDESLSIHLSYLEIYQEIGYDLLNPGARTQSYVTPFPKVSVLEGSGGMCIVRNLSNHLAASEDVAQSLLLQGQANRKVAATAVHDRSSRSHAVFTIQLTAKKINSDTVVRSKLHLVDLAGSERVAKTRVLGQQLLEAKSINLSLHYLESVIVALQSESVSREKSGRTRTASSNKRYSAQARPSSADGNRTRHVPYRNSLLTMLLRDSLGGNCMTSMIATISLESSNLGESISTCRFALRVACIANTVTRNEELDERSLIRKLRKRIAELEAELACLKLTQAGEENGMQLTEEDKQICAEVVRQYLSGKVKDPVTAGITNPYKFRECLKILKRIISKDPNNNNGTGSLSVVLPRHEGVENGDEPDNFAEIIRPGANTFERRSGQKLKSEDDVETSNLSNGPSSRPPTTSAWSKTDSRTSTRQSGRSQGGSAWIGRSASAPQKTGEKTWNSNSKKDPDNQKDPETLSNILESDKMRTPYEQKRVEEIKKMNSRVEKIATERLNKEQEISELKSQVMEKELDVMERHMRTKVSVTAAQVEDQKAYVKQLTTTEADHTLIEQEKLVERQLKKRLQKFEGQLEYIEYRRELLRKHTNGTTEEFDKKATVQDKFGQFRNRDGSLNTRQVFQMLKSEEKKETKAKTQTERQKIIAEANLMEMKELATRQKLRELKEAMKSGSAFSPVLNGHVEENSKATGSSVNEDNSGQNVANESNVSAVMDNSVVMNGGRTADVENADNQKAGPSQSRSPGPVPGSDFYANRKQEKDPSSKWASNYSRPTTPSNLQIPDTEKAKEDKVKVHRVAFSGASESDDKTENENKKAGLSEELIEEKSRKIEEELYHTKNRKFREKNRRLYDNGDPQNVQTYMPSEYVYGMTNPQQFDARRMGLSSKNFDSALNSMLGKENTKVYLENGDYEQFARTSKYQPNPYMQLMKPTPPKQRSQSMKAVNRDAGRSVSERSMWRDSRPVTDDSLRPISKDSQRPISKDSQRPISKDSQRPITRESRRSLPRDRRRNQEPKTPEKKGNRTSNYEVDNSPISAKIARYIQQPPSREGAPKLEIKFASDGEAEGFDLTKFLRSNTAGSILQPHNAALEIEEERGGKVTAMKEQEREKTFMNKANLERDRVNRIRKARQSAEIIQRAWRRFLAKKRFKRR